MYGASLSLQLLFQFTLQTSKVHVLGRGSVIFIYINLQQTQWWYCSRAC